MLSNAPMNRNLAIVLLTAFALRAIAVWSGLSHGVDHLITSDDYLAIAVQWKSTGLFPAHALFFPPLYPMLCKVMLLLFGASAIYGVLAAQVLLGTGTVFFVWLVACRITGSERVAFLAGLVTAADPLLLVHTPMILTETLYAFLLAALVATLICLDVNRRGHFFLLGMVVGLALLTRSVGLVLWPVLVFFWKLQRWPWRWLGVVALVAFALCLPRMLNNLERFGRFEVTASGKYNISALWIGQAKAMMEGKNYGANLTMWGIAHRDHSSTFAQADEAFPQAMAWAREHPAVVIRAVMRGVASLLFGPGSSCYSAIFGWQPWLYAYTVAFYRGLLLLGAVAGLGMLIKADFRLPFMIGGLLAVHTLAPGAAGYSRFAVPGESLEILLAAVALRNTLVPASRNGADIRIAESTAGG